MRNYSTLLGVSPSDPVVRLLPASYAAVAAVGLLWGLVLKIRRPRLYDVLGLGAFAVTERLAFVREVSHD